MNTKRGSCALEKNEKLLDAPLGKSSFNEIKKIIERDFNKENLQEILLLLDRYKGDTEKGKYRVWAAIIKLSNGNVKKMKENIEIAIVDYRDVIAYAEYPEYSEKIGFNSKKYNSKFINEIIKRDWKQYKKWKKYGTQQTNEEDV
jgi:hypothetical protein